MPFGRILPAAIQSPNLQVTVSKLHAPTRSADANTVPVSVNTGATRTVASDISVVTDTVSWRTVAGHLTDDRSDNGLSLAIAI